jgi:hypothetical protein
MVENGPTRAIVQPVDLEISEGWTTDLGERNPRSTDCVPARTDEKHAIVPCEG